MAIYLISYDLEGDISRERYVALGEALQKRGAVRVLLSQWKKEGASAQAVFQSVADLITEKDRLLVSPYTDVWQHNLLG